MKTKVNCWLIFLVLIFVSCEKEKTPQPSLTADFNISYTDADHVVFNNISVNPPDTKYSWNFGDGSTTDDNSPSHFFDCGEYLVTLTSSLIGYDSSVVTKPVKISSSLDWCWELPPNINYLVALTLNFKTGTSPDAFSNLDLDSVSVVSYEIMTNNPIDTVLFKYLYSREVPGITFGGADIWFPSGTDATEGVYCDYTIFIGNRIFTLKNFDVELTGMGGCSCGNYIIKSIELNGEKIELNEAHSTVTVTKTD